MNRTFIDVNEFREKIIKDHQDFLATACEFPTHYAEEYIEGVKANYEDMLDFLDKADTILESSYCNDDSNYWLITDDGDVKCSHCGNALNNTATFFCSHCGADMRNGTGFINLRLKTEATIDSTTFSFEAKYPDSKEF